MTNLIQKIFLLVFLTFAAVGIAVGALWYSNYLSTRTISPIDTGLGYGTYGITSYQKTDNVVNNKISTTIVSKSTAGTYDVEAYLDALQKDITNLPPTALVNLNLSFGKNGEYNLQYYPTSNTSYTDGNFVKTKNVFIKTISGTPAEYELNVKGQGTQFYAESTQTVSGLSWEGEGVSNPTVTAWQKLATTTLDGLRPTDQDTIKISLNIPVAADTKKAVNFKTSFYVRNQKDNDTARLENFQNYAPILSNTISGFHFVDFAYTYADANAKQVLLTVEEPANSQEAVNNFTTQILTPGPAKIRIDTVEGTTPVAVFPSYYVQQ